MFKIRYKLKKASQIIHLQGFISLSVVPPGLEPGAY